MRLRKTGPPAAYTIFFFFPFINVDRVESDLLQTAFSVEKFQDAILIILVYDIKSSSTAQAS